MLAVVIDALLAEHRNMARLLTALEHQVELVALAGEPDYQLILSIARYFCEYPDRCHHPKENAVLEQLRMKFPLEEKSLSYLAWEHIDAYERVVRFHQSVDELIHGAIIPRAALVKAALSFITAERRHMRMEEEVFFPAAEKYLVEEDWSCVEQAITKSCDPLIMNQAENEFKLISESLVEWEKQYGTHLVRDIDQKTSETPFLPWREEFVIGHEGLDAEHRRLADMINEINAAERAGMASQQMNAIVDRLRCLAVDHFQHENSILTKISSSPLPSAGDRQSNLRAMVDASISEHIISHRRSLTKLGNIILDINSALNSVEQSFSKDLKAWFIDHVKDFDAPLKAVFKTMPNRVF